jgi:hypothetical protein
MERLMTCQNIACHKSFKVSSPGLIIFLIHRPILNSFFVALTPILSVRMYESGEELLHLEEIQQRFKKVFGRDMTRTERDIFFLPIEPSPEQEDND